MADVNNTQETLQELVRRRAAELGAPGKPLSANALAKRGAGMVSYETMRRIEQGRHNTIGDQVADGVAIALDVPVSLVLTAAGQRQRLGRFELPRRADRLVQSERDLIIDMIDGLLEAAERRQLGVGGAGGPRAGAGGPVALSGWRQTDQAPRNQGGAR